jgi:hypothetical protein
MWIRFLLPLEEVIPAAMFQHMEGIAIRFADQRMPRAPRLPDGYPRSCRPIDNSPALC